jgi:hypothetical protein
LVASQVVLSYKALGSYAKVVWRQMHLHSSSDYLVVTTVIDSVKACSSF